MDAKTHFSIRHLLLYTLVVAVLAVVPMHAPRIVLSHVGAGFVWLVYNAMLLVAAAYPLWLFYGRRSVLVATTMLLFTANFGPEIVTLADLSITGDNDTTGYWLAERGLDYDPFLSVPCWCSIASIEFTQWDNHGTLSEACDRI